MDRAETTRLLGDARDGSARALNLLFERCADRLLALIRLRMGRALRARMESRDILQATLLKAFQSVERFEGSDARSLMAWLATIAGNEIRDQAEYHGRLRRDAGRDAPGPEGLDDLVARVRSQISRVILDEELERVERALEELDEPHREVILLRNFEELSFDEVGRRLGKSSDACRMLLARAMTALTLKVRELS